MVKKKKEDKEYKGNRIISKRIFKPTQKMTVKISTEKPEEYYPIYFKKEIEDARKSMFFSWNFRRGEKGWTRKDKL